MPRQKPKRGETEDIAWVQKPKKNHTLPVVFAGILITFFALAAFGGSKNSDETSRRQSPTSEQAGNQSEFATNTVQAAATVTENQTLLHQLETILGTITIARMNTLTVNEESSLVTVDFNILGGSNLPAAKQQMGEMLCSLLNNGAGDYTITFIGRLANGEIGITVTILGEGYVPINCSRIADINWEAISEEYILAVELQPEAPTAQAEAQSANPVATTNTSQRPANCDEALAMGLTETQAGAWSHLDRDDDGKACYGD
jgi:hypothetical protein